MPGKQIAGERYGGGALEKIQYENGISGSLSRTRFTLVAPGFRLPTRKISTPCLRAIKVAKEREPKRYPAPQYNAICQKRFIAVKTISLAFNGYNTTTNADAIELLENDALKGSFTGTTVQIDHVQGQAAEVISDSGTWPQY